MKPILQKSFPFLVAAVLWLPSGTQYAFAETTDEWTRYPLIAHALGGIEGVDYTNSFEAFTTNYDKGQRVFEIDLSLTVDGYLVARHDWQGYLADKLRQNVPQEKRDVPLTLKEFKRYKILDHYMPLSFTDVARILEKYPDVYFITDTKETDLDLVTKQFKIIRDTADKIGPAILDRLIPEIYTPEMMETVKGLVPFKHVIFSIYLSPMKPDEVVRYAKENGIKVVAMPVERATRKFIKDLNNAGVVSYVHSLNKTGELAKYLNMGVHGVYTDFLTYKDVGIDPGPLYAAGTQLSTSPQQAAAQPTVVAAAPAPNLERRTPWEALKLLLSEIFT